MIYIYIYIGLLIIFADCVRAEDIRGGYIYIHIYMYIYIVVYVVDIYIYVYTFAEYIFAQLLKAMLYINAYMYTYGIAYVLKLERKLVVLSCVAQTILLARVHL